MLVDIVSTAALLLQTMFAAHALRLDGSRRLRRPESCAVQMLQDLQNLPTPTQITEPGTSASSDQRVWRCPALFTQVQSAVRCLWCNATSSVSGEHAVREPLYILAAASALEITFACHDQPAVHRCNPGSNTSIYCCLKDGKACATRSCCTVIVVCLMLADHRHIGRESCLACCQEYNLYLCSDILQMM